MASFNAGLNFELFKFNREGVRGFLRGDGVRDCVAEYGNRIAATAQRMYHGGGYYGCNTKVGRERCHAFVYTSGQRAIRSNAKNNTLLKAMYRGGR